MANYIGICTEGVLAICKTAYPEAERDPDHPTRIWLDKGKTQITNDENTPDMFIYYTVFNQFKSFDIMSVYESEVKKALIEHTCGVLPCSTRTIDLKKPIDSIMENYP